MPELPQIAPIEPGYYSSDIRRCSFGEFRRLGGNSIFRAALLYLFRNVLPIEFKEGEWLPQYWDDIAAEASELSEECLDVLMPPLAELERQGFYLASYQKLRRHCNPLSLDTGGACLLHPGGEFAARIIWFKNRKPAPQTGDMKILAVEIATGCMSGRTLSVVNTQFYLDPIPPREIVVLEDAPVVALWKRAQVERQRLNAQGDPPLFIRTAEELKQNYNTQEERTWHNRVNVRRLLVRMNSEQIEAALQNMTANRYEEEIEE